MIKANFGHWRDDRFKELEKDEMVPLRAELLSADQMVQYGKALAGQHVIEPTDKQDRLLVRLADNSIALRQACEVLIQDSKAQLASAPSTIAPVSNALPITPAGEWLLDNFYLIEEQILTATAHLPKGYSRELPQLAQGPSRGLPRVYDLALSAISHSDGRLDLATLERFVTAYQTITPLALGELWAIPIMLRLALLENLRRVAARISADRQHSLEADYWAAQMLETAEHDPKSLIVVIADMARSNPPMVSAFVAQLARRLRGHGSALALGLTWIEQRLAESSLTIEQMVLTWNQQQAADQVSISNSIGSLRILGATNWQLFVEAMSHVEQLLRQDLAGVYEAMDFATRDRYRHVVDRLAKASRHSELAIARTALGLAQEGYQSPQNHVGYYLIGSGLPRLEQTLQARVSATVRLARAVARFPLTLHFGAAMSLNVLFVATLLHQAHAHGKQGWWLLALAALCFLGISQLGLSLTNMFATLLVSPNLLPRMDFSKAHASDPAQTKARHGGIPNAMKTLVVVPTMLTSAADIEALVEGLEVRYLGNQDANLYFALLTDFTDATQSTLPSDAPLLAIARDGIAQLNRKYRNEDDHNDSAPSAGRFFLLHRPRLWNPSEGAWMGYERKRGKLGALNALLRGTGQQHFSLIVGNLALLEHVKYVITLDTDTELPRDAARQFIGAMAHPLNQPQFDLKKGRVSRGYGILQPRMAASMAGRSIYAQLCASEPGIDPYTRSVSDVYQDLYGEGSFIGKGIYDIDAFEQALDQRLPENRILSHDLLEGCYARSGLLSDVHLYEHYPAGYLSDMARQARWIRGDWQIAHWCLANVRAPGTAHTVANPLSILSRGKIFDNLRRSLVPAALLLMLLVGVGIMAQPWFWTLSVLSIILLPAVLSSLLSAARWPAQVPFRQHLQGVARSTAQSFALLSFRIACLPYEAYISVDAVTRACWRMAVSKRQLLAWRTSDSTNSSNSSVIGTYRAMWAAPFAALVLLVVSRGQLAALIPAVIVASLWFLAPLWAWWLSQPVVAKPANLSAEQHIFLRKIARKTWAFFERFVNADEHYLPPDNYQLHPGPILAHRTSPTNMGLALLANLSAYDFGFISCANLLKRCENTLATMASLPRFYGHFYNWYDTTTLASLAPRYVSTVDSGNLAGHLVTLRGGLLELPDNPILSAQTLQGLRDTLSVVIDATPEMQRKRLAPIQNLLIKPVGTLLATQAAPGAIAQILFQLAERSASLIASIDVSLEPNAGEWSIALDQQIRDAVSEIDSLMPWLRLAVPSPTESFGVVELLNGAATLNSIAVLPAQLTPLVDAALRMPITAAQSTWLSAIQGHIIAASSNATERIASTTRLAQISDELSDLDYEFLYDPARKLLAIGYNADEQRRDTGFYDLLASESRQGYFIAIAFGQIPQESWFALGRLRTNVGGAPILMSWSGSMFEYLMPQLVMPSFSDTLLDESCRAAVSRQIAFGNERGLPWGVSESGYSKTDANLNYQYHAFGVPGLGLQRGLAVDSVVAPYAAVMALMVQPNAACANLQRFAANGVEGNFGFFEAVDYTPSRIARGQSSVVVRSFMAHHQGMSLLSIAHLLLDQPMQRRFVNEPRVQATLLLLQERIPKNAIFHQRLNDQSAALFCDAQSSLNYVSMGAHTAQPQVQLLSNGRYHVMLTNAGSGYSRWQASLGLATTSDTTAAPIAISRWREDASCDHFGTFFYVRDLQSGEFWSATHQPTCARADSYEAIFSEGRAEYRRRDFEIDCATEVVISPEDDIEVRRITLTNRASRTRTIELTSYSEVVIAAQMAELMQPAFSNLFVQTEIIAARRAILCTRRPRSSAEPSAWMFHMLSTNGDAITDFSYETDRMRFIGRGRELSAPLALVPPGSSAAAISGRSALSNTQGSVLDPIVAIRCTVTLKPGQSASLDYVSGAGANREACMQLVERYQDRHHADRVFDMAWTHSGVSLRQLDVSEADAQAYRALAGHILYASAALRANASVMLQNRRGQSGLWGYAISGDLPILLLKIANSDNIALAQSVIECHSYLRLKGLVFDLVIWNEDHAGYRQRLQDQIIGLVASGIDAHVIDRPGGVFIRTGEQISYEDRILLQAVARVIIDDSHGSFAEQINRSPAAQQRVPRLHVYGARRTDVSGAVPIELAATRNSFPRRSDLLLSNGIGGFNSDASEYIITTTTALMPPLPWVNVLANAQFGSVVSERGMGYSWSENAHEFRLTPWSDDPIGATSGEAFYLRDEQSGHYWSPTPAPCADAMPYTTRHGFGYSVFEHSAGGIESELTVFVDLTEAIKFSVLKVRNTSGRARKLSATGYVEWVLGDLKSKTAMHIATEIDASSGAIFARNHYNTEFAGRIAFFDVDDPARTLSGDRSEFLGRNGSIKTPAAMSRAWLSGRVGAALDPCAAIHVPFELADGAERQIIFRLGAASNVEAARSLSLRMRKSGSARAALASVRQYWQHALSAVQVETPDPAFNVLANGWLVYQTLACRFLARSGFYQSGGAYGFRDQLQDTMALVHVEPSLVRKHLLRAAARQYPEGDVQHWWHPPSGRGVRTRCSDDYLWLPAACCRYIAVTGDASVLDEQVNFLNGRALGPEEESYYDLPSTSSESASLYQHCVRAIENGLRFGVNGLPLMGSGDWNDGMNLVGIHGKGESVWLGFFLYQVLLEFAELSRAHNDSDFAERCSRIAEVLRGNIEANAWDGAWYRRAYFDDGTPLGSASNRECSIDSIAQSWSVLSGAGGISRVQQAMDSLEQRLIKRDAKLVQLLDPPFDPAQKHDPAQKQNATADAQRAQHPGYIAGYVPGVRENGGQYTHAAIWAAMAFAKLGDSARAWEVLNMINPINHSSSPEALAIYKAEPYVIAADVYAVAPHTGRGGWSWYTGSAGWLYRLMLESLLGLMRTGNRLRITPCMPDSWNDYAMRYRFGATYYQINVLRAPAGAATTAMYTLDGIALDATQNGAGVLLVDDQRAHVLDVSVATPNAQEVRAHLA